MAKESRDEKQRRRALEELTTALARQDAETAVTVLLRLQPHERETHLPATARVFQAAVSRDHRAGNWPRLEFWAARAAREPRLAHGQDEVDWALLWGCVRSKQWERAQRLAASLAGKLPARLQAAIEAFIAAQGAPAPELYRGFSAAPEPPDPRLGYDRGQRSSPVEAVSAPTDPAHVEDAVLACSALHSWHHFSSTVERWADANPALAPEILELVIRLHRREILSRMSKSESAVAAATAQARYLRRLGCPAHLEDEMALALRVAASLSRERTAGMNRDEARSLATILSAAAAFPGLRPSAVAVTLSSLFRVEAKAAVFELLEQLCRLPETETSALTLKALTVWSVACEGSDDPPHWVVANLSQALQCPGELARSLSLLPKRTAVMAMECAPFVLPLKDAERFVDQAWAWADESARSVLIDGFDELLRRARGKDSGELPMSVLESLLVQELLRGRIDLGTTDPREMKTILNTYQGRKIAQQLANEVMGDAGGPLPPAAREIWDRFADRVVPYRISYFETALEHAGRKPEKRIQALKSFLGAKEGKAHVVLEAIGSAERERCNLASKALTSHLIERLKGDRDGLAQALLEASRMRLRTGTRGPLAQAFEEADERARAEGQRDSKDVLSARLELQLLGKRRSRAKKPAPKSQRKRRSPRSKAGQTSLPIDKSGGSGW